MRNFIRKWGTMVKHDELMKPIIPPKYNIGLVVHNCNAQLLRELEPWCSTIYSDWGWKTYIEEEQKNTTLDMKKRVKSRLDSKVDNDIVVEFDAKDLNQENFNHIVQLPEILANDEQLEEGSFTLGIFKITINKIKTYEKDLIKCHTI
tara:strand:- start:310 stop:753 length:444 start_codon:yes stop_codon:yes gene_type:complete